MRILSDSRWQDACRGRGLPAVSAGTHLLSSRFIACALGVRRGHGGTVFAAPRKRCDQQDALGRAPTATPESHAQHGQPLDGNLPLAATRTERKEMKAYFPNLPLAYYVHALPQYGLVYIKNPKAGCPRFSCG